MVEAQHPVQAHGGSSRHMAQQHLRSEHPLCAHLSFLQGYQPAVNIFSTHDLQQQASLAAGSSLGYTAVAVSHDGELLAVCADSPDLELSVWHWRKASLQWIIISSHTDASCSWSVLLVSTLLLGRL